MKKLLLVASFVFVSAGFAYAASSHEGHDASHKHENLAQNGEQECPICHKNKKGENK